MPGSLSYSNNIKVKIQKLSQKSFIFHVKILGIPFYIRNKNDCYVNLSICVRSNQISEKCWQILQAEASKITCWITRLAKRWINDLKREDMNIPELENIFP